MATYQDLFMNAINRIISTLITGTQPDKDPGKTAWTWFGASIDAQPAAADDYVTSQLSAGMKTTATAYSPSNNWLTWSVDMNNNLSGATGSVRTWLDTTYVETTLDAPTVPEDVITWTKSNLPTGGVTVLIRKGQPVKS
jgi:hypothetical protein